MSESSSFQSPINIQETTPPSKCEKLGFTYGNARVKVEFDGHAVKASFDEHANQNLAIDIGGVSNHFNLVQFHFHTPAEHAINSVKKEMEVHLVHNFGALSEFYAVISVMVQPATTTMLTSKSKESFKNDFLQCIIDEAGKKDFTDKYCDIDVKDLLPHELRDSELNSGFYTYHGSLTTPPFTENVHWILLHDSLYVNQEIIDQFKELTENNARSIHPTVYNHNNGELCSTQKNDDEL